MGSRIVIPKTMTTSAAPTDTLPDSHGHFGTFGGMFVPETLMAALAELTSEYEQAREDGEFQEELDHLLKEYVGRPTPLTFAERMTEKLGGAKIYMKRDEWKRLGGKSVDEVRDFYLPFI